MPIKISILSVIVGLFIGVVLKAFYDKKTKESTYNKVDKILAEGRKEADKIKRDALFEAKEEINKLKNDADEEVEKKRKEAKDIEERIFQREKNSDRREELLQKREESLDLRDAKILELQQEIQVERVKLEELKQEQITELSKISGLKKEDAKKEIFKRVEEEMSLEIAEYINEMEEEAEEQVEEKAKGLLITSMERFAADVTNERTVSVVNIPSDEMKGRIIGREGRNIRTLEAVTGVDLIIDDTPEAVVLSSFDPFRREIAKKTLETLIQDGRIHPAKIEETYDKVSKNMNKKLVDFGKEALFELGLTRVNKELVKCLGKLKFRTSYGQNALQHSIEVAKLVGLLAGDIGENVKLAKRAGLFHDIGKAIDHDQEGSHVDLGAELALKYKEPQVVIDAIKSHHKDTEAESTIAVLVSVADTLSASRPGARSDTTENYLKRLEDLEKVGNSIEGVDRAYALQAGREIRVIVKPDEIDDFKIRKVAREIKNKIEEELQYPGTIKVTVIRETRTEEEAK